MTATGDSSPPKTIQIKVVGDACAGKTSLIHRYVTGEFSELVKATVGAEFHTSSAKMDGVEYPIQIWDIAGSYRTHQNVTTQFFRRSDAVMICCNASQEDYFHNVVDWRNMVTDFAGPDVPCVLTMTQIDRYVPERNWQAEFQGIAPFDGFYQTSAKDDVGVTEAFRELIRMSFTFVTTRKPTFSRTSATTSNTITESIDIKSLRENNKKPCCKKQ